MHESKQFLPGQFAQWRMWTNIKLCLITYVHVYYSFLIQQLFYVYYAYLLITKSMKILIFVYGEHKKKIIRMYSIYFIFAFTVSNRCPWRSYDCNVVLVLFQRNDVITLAICQKMVTTYDAFVVNLRNIVIQIKNKTKYRQFRMFWFKIC